MWEDPVVKETRKLRKQYAEQFNFDPDLIFNDIRNRQEKLEKKCVSFPSRKAKITQKVA
jgi:hypothetical protein